MPDLHELKQKVYSANMSLPRHGLVLFTWGNVSGIDRDAGLVVIKPSGVSYDELSPENMAVVDMSGNAVGGALRPSSDTQTHLALYRAFPEIGGVVHTHSTYATAFAQAGAAIKPLGTTHADYFYGEIPVTRPLKKKEIKGEYELETGNVIIETLKGKNPMNIPAALVRGHGPFAWGKTPEEAAHNAVVLEEVAKMASIVYSISPVTSGLTQAAGISRALLERHYLRKHGKDAYYGQ